ncbi:tail fiber protein [Salmonella enterica]|nr:tail fiber protein [Salmonella enterica]
MGDGSALPVGVPVPWPLPNPPEGWLKYNGAPFDKNRYPKLGAVYPAGVLPDLRGEFIRGWDDSRGVDIRRILLSFQEHSIIDHAHCQQLWTGNPATSSTVVDGIAYAPLASPGDGGILYSDLEPVNLPSAARALGTRGVISGNFGIETRPRNIAFNYIVRAA